VTNVSTKIPAVKDTAKESHTKNLAAVPIENPMNWRTWLSVAAGVFIALSLVEFIVVNDGWQWDVVFSYLFSERILSGVANTLMLTIVSSAIGLVLGLIAAAARLSNSRLLQALAFAYIWVTRATPLLVIVLFVFFLAALAPVLKIGIPFLEPIFEIPTNDVVTRLTAAIAALSLYLGGKCAEIFRSGILSVNNGQFEACRSLGFDRWTTYSKVVGPQATRIILPPLSNELITMFKNTSLVSVIGFAELLTVVQSTYSRTFETIPLLTVAVIWYLALTSVAMYFQGRLEKRFGKGFDKRARSIEKVSPELNEEGSLTKR
jgi:polar amino acid transport system permease protein